MKHNKQMKLYYPVCIDNNRQMKLYSPWCMDNNRQMQLDPLFVWKQQTNETVLTRVYGK